MPSIIINPAHYSAHLSFSVSSCIISLNSFLSLSIGYFFLGLIAIAHKQIHSYRLFVCSFPQKPSENVFEIWLEYQDVGTPCIVFFTITHLSSQLVQMYFNFLSHSPILAALNLHRLLRHCIGGFLQLRYLSIQSFLAFYSQNVWLNLQVALLLGLGKRERKRELIWSFVLGWLLLCGSEVSKSSRTFLGIEEFGGYLQFLGFQYIGSIFGGQSWGAFNIERKIRITLLFLKNCKGGLRKA